MNLRWRRARDREEPHAQLDLNQLVEEEVEVEEGREERREERRGQRWREGGEEEDEEEARGRRSSSIRTSGHSIRAANAKGSNADGVDAK